MLDLRTRASIALLLFLSALVAQILDLFSGLLLIAGAFPTYRHKEESALFVVILFGAVLLLSMGCKTAERWAVICLGSLLLLACVGGVNNVLFDAPMRVRLYWFSGSVATAILLGWLVVGAFKTEKIGWLDIALSVSMSAAFVSYLFVAPRFAGW